MWGKKNKDAKESEATSADAMTADAGAADTTTEDATTAEATTADPGAAAGAGAGAGSADGAADERTGVERVGETDGIGSTGVGTGEDSDSTARVEDVEGGERVDRGESLTDPGAVDEVPPAPRDPEPGDRVGEEPIDAATGEYSAELDQALADVRGPEDAGGAADARGSEEASGAVDTSGAEEAGGADEARGAYESRHGGGVDDAGVLADAPDDSSGSVLPGDGAVTDESAVDQTPEAAAAGDDDALRDADSADSLEQDVDTDADREQREAEDAGQSEEDQAREEEERREREEAFAREHDPEQHDTEAGEEFRQRGDWTADEHGGPQVQEPDGTIHDPGTEGDARAEGNEGDEESSATAAESGGDAGESGADEVRDGGHGWGSAAPLESGAQPLGHPVKAWHDTMTYVLPGEPGYDADPHEWFVDEEAAQRAGFGPAHGG